MFSMSMSSEFQRKLLKELIFRLKLLYVPHNAFIIKFADTIHDLVAGSYCRLGVL